MLNLNFSLLQHSLAESVRVKWKGRVFLGDCATFDENWIFNWEYWDYPQVIIPSVRVSQYACSGPAGGRRGTNPGPVVCHSWLATCVLPE